MKEFKKGYIYSCKGIDYLILNKTKCFITYQEIFHLGRFNEKFHEPKKLNLQLFQIWKLSTLAQ